MSRKIELKAVFTVFDSVEELDGADRELVDCARQAATAAYAPYSEFQVGASLRLEDGTLIHGNNQENASYTLGLCAERVALFAAGANHPGKKIVAMAITARSPHFEITRPIAPCGACRQAIAEYEHRYKQPIRLVLTGEKGEILVAESIDGLLPLQFTADDLKSK